MLINLDKLNFNEKGYVRNISCNEKITRRLYDLGLLENTSISPIFSSPFGDPIAYEFRGNLISIRNEDAHNIIVEIN